MLLCTITCKTAVRVQGVVREGHAAAPGEAGQGRRLAGLSILETSVRVVGLRYTSGAVQVSRQCQRRCTGEILGEKGGGMSGQARDTSNNIRLDVRDHAGRCPDEAAERRNHQQNRRPNAAATPDRHRGTGEREIRQLAPGLQRMFPSWQHRLLISGRIIRSH